MQTFILGIDIGGTMIKGGLFSVDGQLIRKQSVPTQADASAEALCSGIEELISLLRPENEPVSSLGIGIAGLLTPERDRLIESPNLPALHDVGLKSMLADRLDMSVHLENDANVAALGELWAGAGMGISNFLLFTLGTGIGSGLILNGSLWKGEAGKAGEFGHITVDHSPDAPQCGCGRRGCLEALSSGTAIVRMARDALQADQPTSLQSDFRTCPERLTPEIVYRAAKQGDDLSVSIYRTAACRLGTALGTVNNLLDIHTFIVGGGVSKAFDIMDEIVREEARRRMFSVSHDRLRIMLSRLGNDAGIFGAGFLALQSRA